MFWSMALPIWGKGRIPFPKGLWHCLMPTSVIFEVIEVTSVIFQVLVVTSEKETEGFLAPSITILARKGWKDGATFEKCTKRLKIEFLKKFELLQKLEKADSIEAKVLNLP